MKPIRPKVAVVEPASSPRQLGYRMPAEWDPHRATWLAWPRNSDTWPAPLDVVREIWMQMILAISPAEEVCLLVNDCTTQAEVSRRLRAAGASMERVIFYTIPTVDVWIRDYGPTFVTRKKGEEERLGFIDWIFNAWGEKYQDYTQDDSVNKELARRIGLPVFQPGMVLEGGSFDVNGLGTCLTTEQCLLNPNRNPHLGRSEIEQVLRDYLNVRHIIWLGLGIAGDDTDGHIDDIARFVSPTTVVCCVEDDPRDENYGPLRENYERLLDATDQDGTKLTVVPLPSPGAVTCDGRRLPASYANFYITNGAILVPTYEHPNDRRALGILTELFPDRKVLGISCTELVPGMGAIHCVTQQEPLP